MTWHRTRFGSLMSKNFRVRLVHILPTCVSIVDSQLFLEPELEEQIIFEVSNSPLLEPSDALQSILGVSSLNSRFHESFASSIPPFLALERREDAVPPSSPP